MHICHVITRLIVGGAQENTVLSCRGLVERGHRVTLIAGPETGPEGSLWGDAEESGAELVRVDSMRRAVLPVQDVRARRELVGAFRDLAPDVVHTHSSKAGILGRSAAAMAGVPVIVHTIHGMSFNRTQSHFTQWLYRTLERRAARHTTKLIAVADAMIDQSVAAGVAPRDRFVTIRSGMETGRFAPNADARREVRADWGMGEGDVVVGTLARLFENKGYEEIIAAMPDAVARQRNLRFVWVGDGKHWTRYERQLDAFGLRDRVRMTGLVHPAEVARLINGFDVLVHASRWEGLPRAVVQALLTAVPAVSFDNDGAPEVVLPGSTGLLVPFGDVRALSDAIVSLASDPQRRRVMGAAGRAMCVEMFDWRGMVDRLDELYTSLVKRQPRR
jgi:glycosyltransferase involved in cell wall biosynthesis